MFTYTTGGIVVAGRVIKHRDEIHVRREVLLPGWNQINVLLDDDAALQNLPFHASICNPPDV